MADVAVADVVRSLLELLLRSDDVNACGLDVFLQSDADRRQFSSVDAHLQQLVRTCLSVDATSRPSPAQVLASDVFESLRQDVNSCDVSAAQTPRFDFLASSSPRSQRLSVTSATPTFEARPSVEEQLSESPIDEVS